MPTNRFEGIDLSIEPALARMAKSVARQRVEIITEMAQLLYDNGEKNAATLLQARATEELKEVGL